MRILRRLALAAAVLLAALALGIAVLSLLPAWTPAIEGEHAIAVIERVELGGHPQTILIRGHDVRNPVLLYIHGGPGAAQLPIARFYSEDLERHFTVVHWDQRGAGASCDGIDWATLTREQIVADAIELSEHLAGRFGGDGRIVLLGHSWGSVVGTLAVQQRPDLFHAYVGMGQVVHGLRNEQLSYRWVVDEAERLGDEEAIAELAGVSPPYETTRELSTQRRWLAAYRGSVHEVERARGIAGSVLFAPEYTLGQRLDWYPCFISTLDHLWHAVGSVDFPRDVTRLDVPVFLFTGRHDWNTPFPLVEEWAAGLEAPRVEIVWFEDAAHVPPAESPEEFQRALIERVLPLVR